MEIIPDLEVGYPDSEHGYLIVDPLNCQITSDRYELVKYVRRMFINLFRIEPERTFWCEGYNVAYAGPIPEVTRL